MNNKQSTGVNKLLLLSTILLIVFGIVVVYTASSPRAVFKGLAPEYYLKEHCEKVLVALLAMFAAAKVDYSIWKKFARVVFGVGCVLTVASLFEPAVNGAHRWFHGIQPSEILKLGFIVMVATKLSDAGTEFEDFKSSIIKPSIPFAIAAFLLFLQPNMSMIGLYSGILLSMLIVAGVQFKFLGPICGVGALGGICALLSKEHAVNRLKSFFNAAGGEDFASQGARSLEALGNGGFLGTGVGMSALKNGYLPEAHKDVVYSVVGEEFGFVGTLAVLLVFAVLFYQGFEIARNSTTRFGKYMAVALTISLFLNFVIHVCVSTGLIPTTGQPLPFISYGGTNLIMSGLFIGILLNISKPGTGKMVNEVSGDGVKTRAFTVSEFEITRAET